MTTFMPVLGTSCCSSRPRPGFCLASARRRHRPARRAGRPVRSCRGCSRERPRSWRGARCRANDPTVISSSSPKLVRRSSSTLSGESSRPDPGFQFPARVASRTPWTRIRLSRFQRPAPTRTFGRCRLGGCRKACSATLCSSRRTGSSSFVRLSWNRPISTKAARSLATANGSPPSIARPWPHSAASSDPSG